MFGKLTGKTPREYRKKNDLDGTFNFDE
ncbi:hypothetical protein [Paenibacillus sp. Soil522]|nr:hypothetical protein [Paenibacillus sp. Soil522]